MSPRQWQPLFRSKQEIEQICERFRKDHCAGYIFPLDLEMVVEKQLGLELIPISGIRSARVSAFLKSDFSGIVVDLAEYMDDRYQARMRFSIAHELGHFIMHQDLYRQFHIETLDDYIDFISDIDEAAYRSVEFQANLFAAVLLVPRTALIQQLRRIIRESSHTIPGEFQKDSFFSLLWLAPTVSRKFGVSDEMIERRIRDENISKSEVE